jgi:hypothetical protein
MIIAIIEFAAMHTHPKFGGRVRIILGCSPYNRPQLGWLGWLRLTKDLNVEII